MTRNVFIADDDESVRNSLMHLVSILPQTRVQTFATGDLFLAAADHLPPGCLLLDLHMPGTSGIGVLEVLTQMGDRFPTVVLTGEGDVNLAVHAMKLGATDFLEKPCDHVRLLDAIEHAFARQSEMVEFETRQALALAKIESLSSREREVLIGLMNGRSNKLIAHDLDISHRTIEIYRAKLMEKLNAGNLADALRIAFAAGLYPEG